MGTCFSKKKKKSKLEDRFVSCPLSLHLHGILIWSSIDGTDPHTLLSYSGPRNVPMIPHNTSLGQETHSTGEGVFKLVPVVPLESKVQVGEENHHDLTSLSQQTHGTSLSGVFKLVPVVPLESKVQVGEENHHDTSLSQQTHGTSLSGVFKLVPVVPLESKVQVGEEDMNYTEYGEMIQVNKSLIVQHLLLHDVLPYLWFIENHDRFYEEMKHGSQKTAVVRLLEEIENSEEPQKWQKFIDALKASGYTYIVDTIKGYISINQRHQQEYIKRHTPEIARMISPPELIPFLIANELLSDTDRDNILCECKNNGNYAGAVLLLDRITRKHGNWYMLFIKALKEASCHEVADSLQKVAEMEMIRVMNHKELDMFEEANEGKYENEDIEVFHKEFGSSPVQTRPWTKKAPVPTPRKKCMISL